MLEHRIWDCKVDLRIENPRKNSRTRWITDSCNLLIILDDFDDIVDIKTNTSTIDRQLKRKVNGKFTHKNILKHYPLKDLGKSLATS